MILKIRLEIPDDVWDEYQKLSEEDKNRLLAQTEYFCLAYLKGYIKKGA